MMLFCSLVSPDGRKRYQRALLVIGLLHRWEVRSITHSVLLPDMVSCSKAAVYWVPLPIR
jgi:hypothetical protein